MKVLVTGVSSGLGAGLARAHLGRGDEVYGVSRRPPPEDLTAAGLRHVALDLAETGKVRPALEELLAGARDLGVVHLNAGILGTIEDLGDSDLADLRNTFEVNVWANKTVLDALRDLEVRVEQVHAVSSGAAVSGNRGWGGYAVSKAGLNMLVQLYAREWPGTHFVALAPGLVDTAMQDHLCALDDARFAPGIDRLKAARGTPGMPGPDEAGARIVDLLPGLRRLASGSFADLRRLPPAVTATSAPSAPPLHRLDELLPAEIQGIVARKTLIPSIAIRAGEIRAETPTLVRADIGQISGLDPELEVLYGPPVGLPALRSLVAEGFNLAHGLQGERALGPANVCITTGAAEGLSLLFRCFAQGKVVAVPRGHWANYRNGVELAGGKIVVVDFFDHDGALDVAGLREALKREGAAVLVANFPCNPTGAVLVPEEAAALASLIEELGILCVADEVYDRLRYDGGGALSLLTLAPGHVVTVSSASKEYLLPGARVGYVLSGSTHLTDQVLRKLVRASTASPNVLGQRKLLELLEGDVAAMREGRDPPVLTRVRDEMGARRDRLVAVLAKHGFEPIGRPGHQPQGTIFLMAALPGWWDGDDQELCDAALDAACVSMVPGGAFGLPGAVRFSYGGMTVAEIEQLDANLGRFREGLA